MALTVPQYQAWLAERHLQMLVLKNGAPKEPLNLSDPATKEQVDKARKAMVDEAFAVAEVFIAECRSRGVSPWEREGL